MKAVIVGATGSLGRALAKREAAVGSELILVASDLRDLNSLKSDLVVRFNAKVDVLALDLSDSDFFRAIDLDGDRYYFPVGTVNNSDRFGINAQAIRSLFQINLLSVADLISNVIATDHYKPIVFIGFGSIAQTRGRSNNVFYSAAKRSLTSLFESLLHASKKENIKPYLFQVGYMKSQLSFGKKMLFPAADPDKIAEAVLYTLIRKSPGVFYLPKFWKAVCWVLRLVPWKIYQKLNF